MGTKPRPKRRKLKRLFVAIGLAVLMFDVAAVAYGVVLAFVPVKTIDVKVIPLPILNESKTVSAGQRLTYSVDYCKFTNLQAETSKQLVGRSITYPLIGSKTNIPDGCHKFVTSRTIIPIDTPPGKYHLELTTSYKVNALQTSTLRYSTDEFTVVAPVPGQAPAVENDSTAPLNQPAAGSVTTTNPLTRSGTTRDMTPSSQAPTSPQNPQPNPQPTPTPAPAPSLLDNAGRTINGIIDAIGRAL